MQKYGVKRLVSLTGAGVDAPQDKPKLLNYLIKFELKMMSGEVLKDAEQHVEVIKKSQLDWVVVRGPMLNKGEVSELRTRQRKHTQSGETTSKMSAFCRL